MVNNESVIDIWLLALEILVRGQDMENKEADAINE